MGQPVPPTVAVERERLTRTTAPIVRPSGILTHRRAMYASRASARARFVMLSWMSSESRGDMRASDRALLRLCHPVLGLVPFTNVSGNTLKPSYTMSTWNPHTVVRMHSSFAIHDR